MARTLFRNARPVWIALAATLLLSAPVWAQKLENTWTDAQYETPEQPLHKLPALLGDKEILDMGVDLFEADGRLNTVIPAGFFEPGSPEIALDAALAPEMIGTGGPFELGTTNLVLMRPKRLTLPQGSAVGAVPIETTEMSFVAGEPIVVSINGETQRWNLRVVSAGHAAEGELTVRQPKPEQGTFDLALPVRPLLVFERDGETLELELSETTLIGAGGVWGPKGTCPSKALDLPQLGLGLCFLDIQLSSPELSLTLAAPTEDLQRPRPFIHGKARNYTDASCLARYAQVMEGAFIGKGAVVGPNAYIGDHAIIGRDAVIGAGAYIGAGAVVEAGAVVDDGTEIGANAYIGAQAVISKNSIVADEARIGARARIGGDSFIGLGARIGADVLGSRELFIGDEATVAAKLFLTNGAMVPAGVTKVNGVYKCHVGGRIVQSTPQECEDMGGWVEGLIPLPNGFEGRVAKVVQRQQVKPIDPDKLPDELKDLQDDVNKAGSDDEEGPIKDREWTEDYDCDDFASDMEEALTEKGYDATLTVYLCWGENPDHSAWNWLWTPGSKWLSGHALTDVHSDDGGIIWVEPQTGEVGVDLDFDGDGSVEYSTEPGSDLTDGEYRIEVYDDRKSCEGAGRRLD